MRLVQWVPRRWRRRVAEVSKFAGVGVVNTVVNLGIFNLLLSVGPLKANLVATTVAATSSYFMNRHWTYRHTPRNRLRREYTLFFFFNVVGLLIESVSLGLARYGLGFDEHSDVVAFNIAKFAGAAMATVFRFWTYRTFVFSASEAGESRPRASSPRAEASKRPESAAPRELSTPPKKRS